MERAIKYDQRYDTLAVVRKAASYTDAGALLALTPSAVAHQIHSIEQELGAPLFRKRGNRLIPTQECELVSEYVEKIHMLCERMDHELDAASSRLRHLVVGITPSVESSALSQVLARYQAGADGLQITVLTKSASSLRDMLKNAVIDLAVADGGLTAEGLSSVLLDTDRLVVAVPNGSPYAEKGMITLRELQQARLILRPQNSGTRSLFDANLKKAGVPLESFHIMMEVDSVATIKRLVAEDYGVSILSNNACARDVSRGRFRTVPLCDMNMVRDIHIYYRQDARHDPLVRELQGLYAEALLE